MNNFTQIDSNFLFGLISFNNKMSEKNLNRPTQYTRKKIENYSYGLNDQIGKGYSSQVYRGRNDDTGTPIMIQKLRLPSKS